MAKEQKTADEIQELVRERSGVPDVIVKIEKREGGRWGAHLMSYEDRAQHERDLKIIDELQRLYDLNS